MVGQELVIFGKVLVLCGDIIICQLLLFMVKVFDDVVIVGFEQFEQWLLKMKMDIDVEVGQDKLVFFGFGFSVELVGYLYIGDNLDICGELNLNKGCYCVYGQCLMICRVWLFFVGLIDQLYLDIEVICWVDDVVVGLCLIGSVEQLISVVFFELVMSQEQVLFYLVLGWLMSIGEDSNMFGEVVLVLGLVGSVLFIGEIVKQFGIQDFQLDIEGIGNSISVVVSGNIIDKFSLCYGVGVFELVNIIVLCYQLIKCFYFEVVSGLVSLLDLFFKCDF